MHHHNTHHSPSTSPMLNRPATKRETPTMSTLIRITTETHTDIGQHITYATTRPTKHTWHTTELDRHTIGAYDTDISAEARSLTAAAIQHYTTGQRLIWHDDTTASAEPTPTTKALLQMKRAEADDLTRRGQTIVEQIKRERAMRRAAMTQTKTTRNSRRGLLTDPKRSIFA